MRLHDTVLGVPAVVWRGCWQPSLSRMSSAGLMALSGNDLAQARQHLEDASRLKPDNAMVWAALAQTYLRGKETALANRGRRRAQPAWRPPTRRCSTRSPCSIRKPEISPRRPRRAAIRVEPGARTRGRGQRRRTCPCAPATPPGHPVGPDGAPARRHRRGASPARPGLRRGQPPDEASAVPLRRGARSFHRSLRLRPGPDAASPRRFRRRLGHLEKACRRFPESAQMHSPTAWRPMGNAASPMPSTPSCASSASIRRWSSPTCFWRGFWTRPATACRKWWPPSRHGKRPSPATTWRSASTPRRSTPPRAIPPKSRPKLRRSIQLNDGYWESHFELGVLLAKNREWKQAAAELSRSIELNPKWRRRTFNSRAPTISSAIPNARAAERAEHQRLTAAETGAGPKDKPLPRSCARRATQNVSRLGSRHIR
jgi:hypothetical protein